MLEESIINTAIPKADNLHASLANDDFHDDKKKLLMLFPSYST